MMKKILLVVLLCCFVFVPSCNINDSKTNIENATRKGTVSWSLDFEKMDYGIDIKIDEDLALEIGDAVLRSHIGEDVENMELVICRPQLKDYFVVTRINKPDERGHISGNDYNVAINIADGRILKIWPGE